MTTDSLNTFQAYSWLALVAIFIGLVPTTSLASDAKIVTGFSALAEGKAEVALRELSAAEDSKESVVELGVLQATAALESGAVEQAQLIYRRLARMTLKPELEAGLILRAKLSYQALALERAKNGLPLPLRISTYSNISPWPLLNINLNRKMLGLPFIGGPLQWEPLDWLPKSGSTPRSLLLSTDMLNMVLTDELRTVFNQAKQMQVAGQPQAAYELLLANEFAGAGNLQFDYLLGTTAIDSGHPDQAIFILLRVLNQSAKHAGARLELGRAYFANGDFLDAQVQFELILQQNPPAAARLLSQQYLLAIETQLAANVSSFVPFIDLKTGYTTNANGATANQQPFRGLAGVPAGVQELALGPNSVEKSSSLLAVSGGLSYSKQFAPRWFVKAGGQINGQINPSAHFVDTHGMNGYLNVEKRVADKYAGSGLDVARSYVNQEFSADVIGLNFIAGNKLTELWSGLVQVRTAISSYNEAQAAAKDSNDYTLGFSASRAPVGDRQLQFSVGLIGQRIDAKTDVNSKRLKGLSAGVVMLPWPSTLLSISAALLEADFDAPVLGSDDRSDRTTILGVGLIRPSKLDPNLSWSMGLDANETRSSLNLFDADALKLTVGARYDFR